MMINNLPLRLVVLISGRGSNLHALIQAIEAGQLNAHIVAVISNRSEAKGLVTANLHGIPTHVIAHKQFDSRESFDMALSQQISFYQPDLVLLAGFMRVLTSRFVESFSPRLINIHPSLLPAFTGLNTHERALQEGVKFHGCTVHVVTAELDHGPILAQGILPVFKQDTPESLANKVLEIEHQLLPAVIKAIGEQRWILKEEKWSYKGEPEIRTIQSGSVWYIG